MGAEAGQAGRGRLWNILGRGTHLNRLGMCLAGPNPEMAGGDSKLRTG